MIQHLAYLWESKRFAICDQHGQVLRELHCGDTFNISTGAGFYPTRIEMNSHTWVILINHRWEYAHDFEGRLVT